MNKDEKKVIMEYYKQKINNIYDITFSTINKIKNSIYNGIPGITYLAGILKRSRFFNHFFH